jgi:hypothetical protein
VSPASAASTVSIHIDGICQTPASDISSSQRRGGPRMDGKTSKKCRRIQPRCFRAPCRGGHTVCS